MAGGEDKNSREEEDETPPPPHHLFEVICRGKEDNAYAVREALEKDDQDRQTILELTDSSGMTPLMHAAWKGKPTVTKMLIDMGADPNGGSHQHDYSALHFGALAGSDSVCRVLVEAGAKVDAVNTVKRTPAQMAAFVGHSNCVAVINNYVPKEDVYYFTRKQPLEKEAKLQPTLAKSIHELVMSMNIHPVRMALELKKTSTMLDNLSKVVLILGLMSDRQFRDRKDVNEVLSLKFHMIHYILKDLLKQKEKYKNKSNFVDLWIKSMLVGRDLDGFPVFQEDFLRQGIKEFPYKESTLFQALVTNFSQSKSYGYSSVSASDYINQSFNGQSGFKDAENCATCGTEGASKKCSGCKVLHYCRQECQKLHWFAHKKVCDNLGHGHK